MKIVRRICCPLLLAFLLLTPRALVQYAQREYVDARFVREETRATGTIVLYHIVRHRPYCGSLTAWLNQQAAAFEKQHKGVYITVEGMDEAAFEERIAYGRRADAYSFGSGSLYRDRLQPLTLGEVPLKQGLFSTEYCVPYGLTVYCMLTKNPQEGDGPRCYANDVLAARLNGGVDEASEQKAQTLYLDLRRAGDLIRYQDGFALAELAPVDAWTDAVCWLGIDRETDPEKAAVLTAFFSFLLRAERQKTLNNLGMLSARADVKDEPPDAQLKAIFRTYQTVVTVDPFRWYTEYDTLCADAANARAGDAEAMRRFQRRMQELTDPPQVLID